MAGQRSRSARLRAPSNRNGFQEQATRELQSKALRYARQRASMVRRAGARIDDLYAVELVQDALTDTWMGTIAWDPTECSLGDHVRSVVKSRSWKHIVEARRCPHLRLDCDDESADMELDAARRHATQGSISPIVLAGLTIKVVTALRRLAEGDPAATAILAAWAEGLVDRDEVLAFTGLAEKDYKAARARLSYLVMSLPQSFRDSARSILRSAS